ncbi:hypothetical protein F9B85_03770 [Heliorestis acidaminivorans]|uniref:Uncharacterized protein n=1 Tax=Heliorestis acidaminivorans TaxID=553427 RepID=A0A6I0EZ10_9FIRM|nr:hypothetical protein [Heliorestis acidaminivorans]KAB2953746.1 hypothetical protein F9B85_03770 [Heliorestis acidaminivorans]
MTEKKHTQGIITSLKMDENKTLMITISSIAPYTFHTSLSSGKKWNIWLTDAVKDPEKSSSVIEDVSLEPSEYA